MKTIGKYCIRGLLGRGGMSVVYRALLPVVVKTVALKWFRPHPTLVDLWGEEYLRSRFVNEAVLLASIRHRHVVEILDFEALVGRPFFTMELHPRTLGTLIGEGPRTDAECRCLPLDDVVRYGHQLLSGLGRLHRAGLIHRDIKPHNLLITDDGILKISDLGLSKLRGELPAETPRGLVVGSPFYVAPEQVRNPEELDLRADLYSAGVVIHRMLTGRFPQDWVKPPSEHHTDADERWDDFLSQAVSQEPGKRFLSAREMGHALDQLGKAWEARKLASCAYPELRLLQETLCEDEPIKPVRSQPVKTSPSAAPRDFQCDALWRPLRFRKSLACFHLAAGCVHDRQTGLTWQAGGSEDPMTWDEAVRYVNRLNEEGFSTISGWRLPTVDELFSILTPPWADLTHCEPPVFDGSQTCLWTSDRCTFVSAWYVDTVSCFAGWGDLSSAFFVRAVSGPAGETGPGPGTQ